MILSVELPAGCTQEREWIVETLLGEFLGLKFVIKAVADTEVRITDGSKACIMPDTFFQKAQTQWGAVASCVMDTSLHFSTDVLPSQPNTVTAQVPVLFGDDRYVCDADRLRLPIDVFGTAFVLMSRYEEFVDTRRDVHNRYAAHFSQVGQPHFLQRPIVNEQIEVMWTCLKYLFPDLERAQRAGGVFASADVDIPYSPGNQSVYRLIRRVGGDLLRRRSLLDVVRSLSSFAATKFGFYHLDPYYPWLEWLLTTNEAAGSRISLFFIADHSGGDIDGVYRLDEPIIRRLMSRVLDGGHTIGLHPSYETYCDPQQLANECSILNHAIGQLAPGIEVTECRQHFLRWSVHETASHQSNAGLQIDSTLGYADAAGFRAGVCYEFGMYDLQRRTRLPIRQRPLIAMEVSLFGENYMNVANHDAALDILLRLKQNCLQFDGDFRLLWHNNMLRTKADRAVYAQVVSGRE